MSLSLLSDSSGSSIVSNTAAAEVNVKSEASENSSKEMPGHVVKLADSNQFMIQVEQLFKGFSDDDWQNLSKISRIQRMTAKYLSQSSSKIKIEFALQRFGLAIGSGLTGAGVGAVLGGTIGGLIGGVTANVPGAIGGAITGAKIGTVAIGSLGLLAGIAQGSKEISKSIQHKPEFWTWYNNILRQDSVASIFQRLIEQEIERTVVEDNRLDYTCRFSLLPLIVPVRFAGDTNKANVYECALITEWIFRKGAPPAPFMYKDDNNNECSSIHRKWTTADLVYDSNAGKRIHSIASAILDRLQEEALKGKASDEIKLLLRGFRFYCNALEETNTAVMREEIAATIKLLEDKKKTNDDFAHLSKVLAKTSA